MNSGETERQIEWSELGQQNPMRPRPQGIGLLSVSIRHDQLIICSIAALIGITVIFAMGVERGKQFGRAEKLLLSPSNGVVSDSSHPGQGEQKMPAQPSQKSTDDANLREIPKRSSPEKKHVTEKSRYAVQVVTYSRPKLAKLELDRLRELGEDAFIEKHNGQTVLYVGPYISKEFASEKKMTLKGRYKDCFVRSL